MNDSRLHIAFSGGGTGGHLFPGLAVAEELVRRAPRARITFAGSGKALERRETAAAGFQYIALPCRPLPRRARDTGTFLAKTIAGMFAAGRFLGRNNVTVVVGLGGYASVPAARAAGRRGLPLLLMEQNAVPGRATRWLARRASLVCTAWPQAQLQIRCRCPVCVTGTPVRRAFGATENTPAAGQRQLLILGGSGGARSVNENLPVALGKIRSPLDRWKIVHQSGERDLEMTRELYRKLALPATVTAFIADMPDVLRRSDLVICRAGGATLAELAVAALPAVLLPYPHATDDHQRCNAELYAGSGAAVMLDQRQVSGRFDDHLACAISELVIDRHRRRRMSAAAGRLARPHAARHVAQNILELAGVSSRQVPARAAA